MHCIKAIAVSLAGLCTTTMADALRRVAPRLQTALEVVRLRVPTRARCDRRVDERRERQGLAVFQPPKHHLTATRDPPEKRRRLGGKRAPSPLALEPSAPSAPPVFATASGLPW